MAKKKKNENDKAKETGAAHLKMMQYFEEVWVLSLDKKITNKHLTELLKPLKKKDKKIPTLKAELLVLFC